MNDQPTNPRNTNIPGLSLRRADMPALSAAIEYLEKEDPPQDSPLREIVEMICASPEERRAAELAEAARSLAAQSETRKPPQKKKPARRKAPRKTPRLSSRDRHEDHCSICASPYREAIDEEFTSWHNVSRIALDYKIERRVVYRHAHAMGLFAIRDRNVRIALGHIIERAESVRASSDSVIRAVRMLTHINEDGEWVQPPAHVIVSSGTALQTRNSLPSASRLLDTPRQVKRSVKR